MTNKTIAYLMHLTHYDPAWVERKASEKPFDLDVAASVLEALQSYGFNALVVSIGDGVIYDSHPELSKHYSVPMSVLQELVAMARAAGMEFIPKFNFSMSAINCHNDWIREPGATWYADLDNKEAYYKKAFALIDEIRSTCAGIKRVHIGMDEDHNRSYTQYVQTIETLRSHLQERGLSTIMWSDAAIAYPNGHIYVEKAQAALAQCSKDIVQVLWDYRDAPTQVAEQIVNSGFELWGAPGWADAVQAEDYISLCRRLGATGLLMTRWSKCIEDNRQDLLDCIHRCAGYYHL